MPSNLSPEGGALVRVSLPVWRSRCGEISAKVLWRGGFFVQRIDFMVPRAGIEPATCRLGVAKSYLQNNDLQRNSLNVHQKPYSLFPLTTH